MAILKLPLMGGTLRHEITHNVNFGKIAPQILAIYSYKRYKSDEDGFEIYAHLRWEAETDIEINAGPVRLALNYLLLDGLGCIVLRPLQDDHPVIGGMQVFFCNPPTVHVGLTGLAGLTALTGIDRKIGGLLEYALRELMVLPRRLTVRIGTTKIEDWPAYRDPPPCGVIRIYVLAARDLVAADVHMTGPRSSDPYCVIRLGTTEFTTRTIKRNCNPVWGDDEFFDFPVYHEQQHVVLNIFDSDALGQNDFLGSLPPVYVITDLLRKQIQEGSGGFWLPLDISHASSDSKEHNSQVQLRVVYFGLEKKHESLENCMRLSREGVGPNLWLLSAKLYHVTGMLPDDALGSILRLTVTGGLSKTEAEVSKKCKGVIPREYYGLGRQMLGIIQRLNDASVPHWVIAKSLQIPEEAVRDVIDFRSKASHSRWNRFGWDQTIHAVVHGIENAVAKLELKVNGHWHRVGEPKILLSDLVKATEEEEASKSMGLFHSTTEDFVGDQSSLFRGPFRKGLPWCVHGYRKGVAMVGVKLRVQMATPMADKSAEQAFVKGFGDCVVTQAAGPAVSAEIPSKSMKTVKTKLKNMGQAVLHRTGSHQHRGSVVVIKSDEDDDFDAEPMPSFHGSGMQDVLRNLPEGFLSAGRARHNSMSRSIIEKMSSCPAVAEASLNSEDDLEEGQALLWWGDQVL